MIDILKKTIITGIGLALQTRDEVETMAGEIVRQGKMSEKEGKQFLEQLLERYDDTRNALEARVEKTVKAILKKADVVTGDDLKALKKEILALKKQIEKKADH